MALIQPKSTNEVLYFTNRTLENGGKIKAWTYKKTCPKCGKAKMGKPVEKGKVKIRSTEYICPECGFTEEKVLHEESLTLDAVFTCPKCKKDGENSAPYKRKTYLGVPSYIVLCPSCNEKIPVTKKMKKPKVKGAPVEDDDGDDD
jgi:predicted RNA-binding Zn-ribbon protein involved in translation (DUF1610 family)